MHSVPHLDRRALDGQWRFQLLHTPEEAPGESWREVAYPVAGRCRASSTCRTTPTSRCPSRAARLDLPDVNPTGVYEREFDLPAEWLAGRRIVLHVGAAESVLIADVNGQRGRRQQGLAPGRRVRRHGHRPKPGPNTISLTGREVVRRHVHRGSGPVVARRHHPVRVPLRHAAGPLLADVRVNAGLTDDLATGTFEVAGRRRLRRRRRARAGLVGRGETGRPGCRSATVPFANAGPGPRVSRADSEPLSRHRFDMVGRLVSVGLTGAEKANGIDWRRNCGRLSTGAQPSGPRSRRVAWSAERPAPLSAPRRLRSPVGRGVEEVRPAVGFRRVEIDGRTC
jgi:hypothetical protein